MHRMIDMGRKISLRQSPETETEIQRLGFKIRLQRFDLGADLKEVAELAEMNLNHLSKIERGRCLPRGTTAHRIANALEQLRIEREGKA